MNCFISAAPYVVRTPTPSPKRLWGHGSRDLCQAGRLPPLCLLRTGKSLCTLIVWKIQTQRSSVEGNGLMTGPTWSMKVGRRSEARSAGACTGLSSDLRPVPRRREGEREKRRGGRLLSREVWRAAQGDPDMEAAAGMQPPWPRPPRPGRPNSLFPESSRPPLPHSQTLALFPESSALAAPARPPPLPRAARGRGRGLRPGPAPASRAPLFPGGRPGPCGPPPGNPGVPNSRLWGLGEAARQNPAPGDLTP